MGQKEAQDHQNDADVLDICPIDILSCYWKPNNGMLMLRINGLNRLCEYVIKDEYFKVDYPYALDIYLIGTSIGMKKSRENRIFRADKEWRD